MGEKNNAMCEYLAKPEIFADFVNAAYFHGEREILPEQLEDCAQVSYGGMKPGSKSGERSRDVVKARCLERNYIIIGIEDQQSIHYAMPLRCMEYDVREYVKQLRRLQEKNKRKNKEAGGGASNGQEICKKLNKGEFLSGIRKTDKLNPVTTIVFYHGKEVYDGCRSLHDMLKL